VKTILLLRESSVFRSGGSTGKATIPIENMHSRETCIR
jgi:hypothetical protein